MSADSIEDQDSTTLLDDGIDDDDAVTEEITPTATHNIRNAPRAQPLRFAAILLYGGKHGGDARGILESFDIWTLTTDVAAIAQVPVYKLVIADSEEEIEERMEERYHHLVTPCYNFVRTVTVNHEKTWWQPVEFWGGAGQEILMLAGHLGVTWRSR